MGRFVIRLPCGFLLLILGVSTLSVTPCTSELYHITPSEDSLCPYCITLAQVNVSNTANLSLILLPGNHVLTSELIITKMESFMMYSANSTDAAKITCGPSAAFTFVDVNTAKIVNLHFFSCGGNKVEKVTKFVLAGLLFHGGENSTTAVILNETSVDIVSCQFVGNTFGTSSFYNTTNLETEKIEEILVRVGGAIFAIHSHVDISDSIFDGNAADNGGAVYAESNSTVLLNNSTFINNKGTVIYTNDSEIVDRGSVYENNTAKVGAVVYSMYGSVSFSGSKFYHNEAELKGGVLLLYKSNLTLVKCDASYNSAQDGGVVYLMYGMLEVRDSMFHYNLATVRAGVMNFENSLEFKVKIKSTSFEFNDAHNLGILHLTGTNLTIVDSVITHNLVNAKGVLHAQDSFIQSEGKLVISENKGNLSIVYFVRCCATFHDGMSFENNSASFMMIDSTLAIDGTSTSTSFKNNGDYLLPSSSIPVLREGGAVTLIRSKLHITGNATFEDNRSNSNGGAIYATESVINLYSQSVSIHFNQAEDSGGGVYLYRSKLKFRGDCTIVGNEVQNRNGTGGGIHAISSSIMIIDRKKINESDMFNRKDGLLLITKGILVSELILDGNTADKGGGLCFELHSKFYLRGKYVEVNFFNNYAQYGGAIFVNDSSIESVCDSDCQCTSDIRTECFIQKPYHNNDGYLNVSHGIKDQIKFTNNSANSSGSILYGGLLDRCTVSQFSDVYYDQYTRSGYIEHLITGVEYFTKLSNITSVDDWEISSRPVRICFCDKSEYNCSYRPPPCKVDRGQACQVEIVAVDQVNQPVGAVIHSSVSPDGDFMEASQRKRDIPKGCQNLTFNVNSTKDSETLSMYAEGPCHSRGMSTSTLEIEFNICTCPTGFQKSNGQGCQCECDEVLQEYTDECSASLNGSSLIRRKNNVWIGYYKEYNNGSYFVYNNCPFDYCQQPTSNENINLSRLNGSDSQCAFNRSGLLCSLCQPGLSLSIGSSRCLECKRSWPAVLFAVILYELALGVVLVASILALDLTVASGTINGILFYANIVASSHHLFLRYDHPNFQTVFINLLNVTIGFDACFIKNLDTLTRTWLGMLFPMYGFALVFILVKLSKCSSKFATLLGKGNPVATLATLTLIFYTKLLRNVIKIFSFAVLRFPDNTSVVVWRPDANIKYFRGSHIPLVLAGVLILVAVTFYTLLLFSWQWLLQLSNKKLKIFKLMRNTKINLFMEANLAPYKPKYRFWMGLLLFVRVILHLVPSSSVNVDNNSRLNLMVVGICVTLLIVIKAYIGDTIYKKAVLDYLELTSYFNLVLLTIMTSYLKLQDDKTIASTTSISITFVIFSLIVLFHIVCAYRKTRCARRMKVLIKMRREKKRHLVSVDNNEYHLNLLSLRRESAMNCSEEVTSSVVSMSPQHGSRPTT